MNDDSKLKTLLGMAAPAVLKPPAELGSCATCRHAAIGGMQELVLMPGTGQPVPVEMVRAAKQIIPKDARRVTTIPCALNPQWVVMLADAYCWQWKPSMSDDPVDKPFTETPL